MSERPDANPPVTAAAITAMALVDGGIKVVTNVPGAGGTAVFEAYRQLSGSALPISFHEEVAFGIAHGASLAGGRAAAILKAHGLAKAGNAVVDALVAGVTAACVVLVTDDPSGAYSDCALDTLALIGGMRLPVLRPAKAELYAALLSAVAESESRQLPVAVVADVDELQGAAALPATRRRLEPPAARYECDVWQHVLCPVLAAHQHATLEARLAGRGPDLPVQSRPALPEVPGALPPKWQSVARGYMPLFDAFRQVRNEASFVCGDTGVATFFAFPPYFCVDVCTYMGGSLPLAIGALLAGHRDVWAVSGDFAFIAAGQLALLEAVQRRLPLKVLILHNGRAEATGGQPIPAGSFEAALAGYASYVLRIDHPQDRSEAIAVLERVKREPGMRIVVAEHSEGDPA
jgi:TPP-dependent indolepyruvate ferredoxin oxidoreductase alpha subunit